MPNNNHEAVIENNAVSTRAAATLRAKPKHAEPMILKLFRLGFKIGGILSPALSGRIAYNLWLTPTKFKTPASELRTLEAADIEFLRIKNHDIATFSWGQPDAASPMILLVHGWAGRGTQLGPFVEPLLKAGYRVLSFDAPAHGRSSGKQTSIYEIADVIVALQTHYGNFDSVITHSFGGPCTALAVERGLKANSIVTICPPATIIGLVEKFVDALHISEKTRTNLIHRIETTFGKDLWKELSMTNMVKKIMIPGFVIHDAQDSDIPWEEGQAVAYAWDNTAFKITNELGHRRILRDKTVIESAINFIQNKKL